MAKKRVKFTFPTQLIKDPLIYKLGHEFNVISNIRRADVREDMGWVVLELDGEEEEIDRSLSWMASNGVRIDPVSGDVVEG
jgi:ABC-type methionine transport system ATPase subunit